MMKIIKRKYKWNRGNRGNRGSKGKKEKRKVRHWYKEIGNDMWWEYIYWVISI